MKLPCSKICIACQPNDSVDIKCGGPKYLGYDFYVKNEEIKEMISFIKTTCADLKVPIISLYYMNSNNKELSELWTKEKIYNCIKNNEAGLDLDPDYSI